MAATFELLSRSAVESRDVKYPRTAVVALSALRTAAPSGVVRPLPAVVVALALRLSCDMASRNSSTMSFWSSSNASMA